MTMKVEVSKNYWIFDLSTVGDLQFSDMYDTNKQFYTRENSCDSKVGHDDPPVSNSTLDQWFSTFSRWRSTKQNKTGLAL